MVVLQTKQRSRSLATVLFMVVLPMLSQPSLIPILQGPGKSIVWVDFKMILQGLGKSIVWVDFKMILQGLGKSFVAEL